MEYECQEGKRVADFALKLVAMATSLDQSGNQYQIEHLHQVTNMSTIPENLVKIGLVVSEISLLQAIVKKKKKESNRNIKPT